MCIIVKHSLNRLAVYVLYTFRAYVFTYNDTKLPMSKSLFKPSKKSQIKTFYKLLEVVVKLTTADDEERSTKLRYLHSSTVPLSSE